ncbi:acylphosphatase [Orbus mooreae]|uniref:acylphosphatase n=1 Tax=Orbus mooreae TaxID=3074107 RepID=UPI00370DC543
MQERISSHYECSVIIHVIGLVQGVGFRFFTYKEAQKLKLVGYVKNLPNDQVEIVACGSRTHITMLIDWLDSGGPRSAQIQNYDVNDFIPNEDYKTFNVRY